MSKVYICVYVRYVWYHVCVVVVPILVQSEVVRTLQLLVFLLTISQLRYCL